MVDWETTAPLGPLQIQGDRLTTSPLDTWDSAQRKRVSLQTLKDLERAWDRRSCASGRAATSRDGPVHDSGPFLFLAIPFEPNGR